VGGSDIFRAYQIGVGADSGCGFTVKTRGLNRNCNPRTIGKHILKRRCKLGLF
jgi:hypothetical protein